LHHAHRVRRAGEAAETNLLPAIDDSLPVDRLWVETRSVLAVIRHHLVFALGEVARALRDDTRRDEAANQLGRDAPAWIDAGVLDVRSHHRRGRLGLPNDHLHLVDLAAVFP